MKLAKYDSNRPDPNRPAKCVDDTEVIFVHASPYGGLENPFRQKGPTEIAKAACGSVITYDSLKTEN